MDGVRCWSPSLARSFKNRSAPNSNSLCTELGSFVATRRSSSITSRLFVPVSSKLNHSSNARRIGKFFPTSLASSKPLSSLNPKLASARSRISRSECRSLPVSVRSDEPGEPSSDIARAFVALPARPPRLD